jgi:hypothetical protein
MDRAFLARFACGRPAARIVRAASPRDRSEATMGNRDKQRKEPKKPKQPKKP